MNPYPLDNIWKKGHYVARINGADPKYVLDREFLNGKPVKTRGVVEYSPDDIGQLPAWVIRTPEQLCPACDRPRNDIGTELIAAHPHGWEPLGFLTSTEILDVYNAGAPGEPGAWTGTRCDTCDRPQLADTCPGCADTAANRDEAAAMSGADTEPL